MWQSPNVGRVPDVKFLRAAGFALVALALVAGAVSLIGGSLAHQEPEVVVAEAVALEKGAAAMFKAIDDNIARRHELSLE
ncbi:MAG TPA: hypothetical protein VIB38_14980 [Aestuariivirgaceae bacterium]|jgi:hypothetical protein